MKPSTATLAAGGAIAVVAMQSLGLFGSEAPSVLSPVSMLLVFPAFMGLPPSLVIALFVALFLLWRPALFAGESRIPIRTVLLLVVVAVLSAIVFATGWGHGMKYQGVRYTSICLALSVVLFAGCIVTAWRGHKRPSFPASLALQAMLFAWVASYAFPYLGETP